MPHQANHLSNHSTMKCKTWYPSSVTLLAFSKFNCRWKWWFKTKMINWLNEGPIVEGETVETCARNREINVMKLEMMAVNMDTILTWITAAFLAELIRRRLSVNSSLSPPFVIRIRRNSSALAPTAIHVIIADKKKTSHISSIAALKSLI